MSQDYESEPMGARKISQEYDKCSAALDLRSESTKDMEATLSKLRKLHRWIVSLPPLQNTEALQDYLKVYRACQQETRSKEMEEIFKTDKSEYARRIYDIYDMWFGAMIEAIQNSGIAWFEKAESASIVVGKNEK
ncbi:MAG: hypothetical protein QW292_12625 [Candidatus Parvarchaeota archaeon]